MLAEVVEFAPHLYCTPVLSHVHPEEPVAAVAHAELHILDFRRHGAAEQHHRGVVDVGSPKEFAHCQQAACVSFGFGCSGAVTIPVHAWDRAPVGIDHVRASESHCRRRVGIEQWDEGGEKFRVGIIVAFGNPYIPAAGKRQPALPLCESAPRILFVKHDAAHLGVVAVGFDYRGAGVG